MVQPGILDGNPINEDITEAADIFLKEKTSTYVAVAANGAGQIFHCEVGPLHTTFVNSCKKLDQACCVHVSQKEDFALISAGGHRTDGQLYQATKALSNAVHAVKKGGDILFVAECAQGAGNSVFASVLRDFQNDPSKIGNELIKKFNTPAWVASNVGAILNRYRVTLVSDFDRSEVEELGFHFTDDIENYIRRLRGRGYIMPFAENILPVIQA